MASQMVKAQRGDRGESWYAKGLSFECTQCGNCCTGPPGCVWFSDEEARAIAAHLEITEDQFRQQYAHLLGGRWSLTEHRTKHGYDCVFLKRDPQGKALCGIYPVRPVQCRTWPFWPQNLETQASWRRAGQRCPGMTSGKLYTVDQIRIIRDSNPDK